MIGPFRITAKTYPKCDDYLKIRWNGEEYKKIEDFISQHSDADESELNTCMINYRGEEKTYREYIDDCSAYSEELKLVEFNLFRIILNSNIRASKYFIEKAMECLQTARFFAIKSRLILDTDYNLRWSQGYIPQYLFRCTYFGTASTWYSNTFDQLLQAVYWAFELYTDAIDKNRNRYDDSWDEKKIMTLCNYKFVIKALKSRGYTEILTLLTSCFEKIKEVRSWANYIKHKGGIEYKDSQPEDPFKVSISLIKSHVETERLDNRFEIKNFKSPIEIDIDEKSSVLLKVHSALYECITKIIAVIDFDEYTLKLGETN